MVNFGSWTFTVCIRALLMVVHALLSVSLIAGGACRLWAAGDCFDATFEVIGGAHRMFREGIDHPALKIGAWSIDRAAHEVAVKFQIEDIFGKPIPNRDE